MKKVVHLTSAHKRYDDRILWRECRSLCEHGYDVTLVVNDAVKNETLENGIKIVSTGFVPKGRKQRLTEGVKRIYGLGIAQNADIYHLHDAELLMIALKLKEHGKKVIFDSHEVYGEVIKGRTWIPWLFRHGLSNIYNLYEGYVCNRIDGVIHIGRYDGKDWFAGRAKRFVHVGNYPRLDEYENIDVPDYRRRKNVCFVGGLSESTGVLTLLEAAEQAHVKLFLAGRFSPEGFENEFAKRDVHHISEYVGFLGRKEIFELYSRCAIGICTQPDSGGQLRKIENFNNKVYEYMSMEMPVILSDFSYKHQMVDKYHFGVVANPDDASDIANKITWLLEHPKEAEEMGKNGKRLLRERFTWDVAEKELLRLYQEVEAD